MESVSNNSPDTINIQILDNNTGAVLDSEGPLVQGAHVSLGTYVYRDADIAVSLSSAPSSILGVSRGYFSNGCVVQVSGSSTLGYQASVYRDSDYWDAFWIGAGLYVGVWVATMYMKFARAGVNQSVS